METNPASGTSEMTDASAAYALAYSPAERDRLRRQPKDDSGVSERQHIGDADALARLLDGYGHALESIAMDPPIIFLPLLAGSEGWLGRRLLLPYANFITSILTTRHIAARIDILIRRGQRFRALHHEPNPVDIDRLQDFRNSLSPVSRKTMFLWIVMFALAVTFPVAWITDRLRLLAPKIIVCSSQFSLRAAISSFVGTSPGPVTSVCRPRPRDNLVNVLVHIAHLNLSPGGVIDAFSSAKAGGTIAIMLLAVIWALSLSVVLLILKSGFRLKRLIFHFEKHTPALSRPPTWYEIGFDGLYRLEKNAFSTVDLSCPREFPLDLAARVGVLVLPLTISVDLLILARPARLDIVTREMLVVGALAFIAFVALQLIWLVQVWRSRTGSRLIRPQRRLLPDGSIVRVNSCAHTVLLIIILFIILEITAVDDPTISRPARISAILFLAPAFAWSLSPLLWYRLHRELASYGRCMQLVLLRIPVLATIPPFSLAATFIIACIWINNQPGSVAFAEGVLALIGLIGMAVSVYRMGRNVEQLRRRAAHRDRKARVAGMYWVILGLVPFAAILYLRHSLNQITLQITTSDP
jgi:hypothetical protein